jgi:hypothetical protein
MFGKHLFRKMDPGLENAEILGALDLCGGYENRPELWTGR